MPAADRGPRSAFERFYTVVVLIKGLDGVVELVLGLLLLLAPHGIQQVVAALAAELAEGSSPIRDAAAASVAHAGHGLATGAPPLAGFLLVHGVVKLATVWCLLARAVRLYPWALAVLAVLLLLQTVDLIARPRPAAVVLVALDVLVVVLVAMEYRRLRRDLAGEEAAIGFEGARG